MMPFQFYCPQGHLLEGHESQMGQQSQCPLCGVLFLIPVVQTAAVAAMYPQVEVFETPAEPPPQIQTGPPQPAPPAEQPSPPQQEPRLLHIPCPQGHELETPEDMLGQDVLCPLCQSQFYLRQEDSVEYQRERAEARRRREEQFNRAVLKWAIVTLVVVVVGIAGMILYLALRKPAGGEGGAVGHRSFRVHSQLVGNRRDLET